LVFGLSSFVCCMIGSILNVAVLKFLFHRPVSNLVYVPRSEEADWATLVMNHAREKGLVGKSIYTFLNGIPKHKRGWLLLQCNCLFISMSDNLTQVKSRTQNTCKYPCQQPLWGIPGREVLGCRAIVSCRAPPAGQKQLI